MASKEFGSIYKVRCPGCGDALVFGWGRDDAVAAVTLDGVDSPAKVKMAGPADLGTKLITGPKTCACGNVTAKFDTTKGRGIAEWVTREPQVENHNLH